MDNALAQVLTSEIELFFKTLRLDVKLVLFTEGGKYYFKIGRHMFLGFFSDVHKNEFFLRTTHNDRREEGFSFVYSSTNPAGKKLNPITFFVSIGYTIQIVYLSDAVFTDPYMKYDPKKGEIILRSIDTRNIYPMICYDKLSNLRFKSKIPAIQFWIEKQIG